MRLLSEVFERKADYFILTKKTFRVETITLCFFGTAYLSCSTRTIENGCVFKFQAKYLCVKLETSGLSRGT